VKITFVVPERHFSGGIKVVAIYAERLQRRGHDVLVVSPQRRVLTLKDRARLLIREGRWSRPPEHSHFDGRNVKLHIYKPYRPVEDADVPSADVIIATWFETALWVAKLTPSKGAKVIFIQGYETLPEQPRPEIDETWRLPFQKIVISRWLKQLAADKFNDTRAAHIPNSVDTAQFFAPLRSMQPVPTVGFLASYSPFKDMKTAIAAIARIRETIPNLRVVSFGAEELRNDMPLPPNTEFHLRPPQNLIRELYAKCDLWLCGSQREGFHLPLLEAMACRCPGVSTRAGGPEDIIEPGKNGFLVDVGDAAGLATACCRLLTAGEETWKKFSDAAFMTATSYTWDDATVLFENELELAISRAAQGEIAGGRKR
jgi:glycosyltransferase involved in cell wall biosynthesis